MCCFCLWKKGVFEYLPYLIIHPGKNLFHCQQHSLTTCPLSTTTLSTTVYHCLPLSATAVLLYTHIPYPISHISYLSTSFPPALWRSIILYPHYHPAIYYTILYSFFSSLFLLSSSVLFLSPFLLSLLPPCPFQFHFPS